ncbi:MAG: hypothetical protein IJC89_03205 [Clostridia bacterium]|nr:hypothetical protein [Clostridia bacterium]
MNCKEEIKTCIISDKTGNLKYDIYYPFIEKKNVVTNSINNFSLFLAKEFEKHIQTNLKKYLIGEEEEFVITRTFKVSYKSRFLLSYKYDISSYNEQSDKILYIESANWDLKNGSAVKLREFFRGNVRYKEIILYIICSKIREAICKGEKFYPDWQARIYSSFSVDRYYISNEGFVIYFPVGVLKSEKSSEFLISFKELRNQISTILLR